MLISRINLRISGGAVGRPPRRLDFQRQYDLKPARRHCMTVCGFTIGNAFRTVGASRYSSAKHQAVHGAERLPFGRMSSQYVKLMPENQAAKEARDRNNQ